MIRRLLMALMSALVLTAFAVGPATAVPSQDPPVDEGDEDDFVPGGVLDGDKRTDGTGPGELDGFGTARSHVTGVQVTAGDLDLRLLDSDMLSTLDHERAGVDMDKAFGTFVAASLSGGTALDAEFEDAGVGRTLPDPPWVAETGGGSDREAFDELPVLIPEADTPVGKIDISGAKDGAQDLLDWVCTDTGVCADDADSGLGGESLVGFARGAILDALVRPGTIDSTMDRTGGTAEGRIEVSKAVMLAGLSEIIDAGAGDLTAGATEDVTRASARGVKIDSMTVVKLESLLGLLDLPLDLLPPTVQAVMADTLGINPVGLLNAANSFESVDELRAAIDDTAAEVKEQLGLGLTCDLVDTELKQSWRNTAGHLGIEPPDCLGVVDALDTFLAALETLQDDFENALDSALSNAALVAVNELWIGGGVEASLGKDGVPEFGEGTHAGISSIMVGAEHVTDVELVDSTEMWNEWEQTVNDRINEVLGVLGPEFQDIVRIRLFPEVVHQTGVEGRYAVGETRTTVMRTTIDLPSIDAGAVIGELTSGGGTDGLLGRGDVTEPITIDLGRFEATAEHTRPGVDPVCTGTCDGSKRINRVFDPDTGDFRPGSDPDEGLPRTGASAGTLPLAVMTVLVGAAYGLSRLSRRPTIEPPPG